MYADEYFCLDYNIAVQRDLDPWFDCVMGIQNTRSHKGLKVVFIYANLHNNDSDEHGDP